VKIAILAWGSLIWDPRNLNVEGTWKLTGFTLPIEFSRFSRVGRLTLVIDHMNGEQVPILYYYSSFRNLNDAIQNLRECEGNTNLQDIGYINLVAKTSRSHNEDDVITIKQWAISEKFDAVIWTDLTSNFFKKRRIRFSIENAVNYLKSLTGETKEKAQMYIRETKDRIYTPLWREIIRILWMEEK